MSALTLAVFEQTLKRLAEERPTIYYIENRYVPEFDDDGSPLVLHLDYGDVYLIHPNNVQYLSEQTGITLHKLTPGELSERTGPWMGRLT